MNSSVIDGGRQSRCSWDTFPDKWMARGLNRDPLFLGIWLVINVYIIPCPSSATHAKTCQQWKISGAQDHFCCSGRWIRIPLFFFCSNRSLTSVRHLQIAQIPSWFSIVSCLSAGCRKLVKSCHYRTRQTWISRAIWGIALELGWGLDKG